MSGKLFLWMNKHIKNTKTQFIFISLIFDKIHQKHENLQFVL